MVKRIFGKHQSPGVLGESSQVHIFATHEEAGSWYRVDGNLEEAIAAEKAPCPVRVESGQTAIEGQRGVSGRSFIRCRLRSQRDTGFRLEGMLKLGGIKRLLRYLRFGTRDSALPQEVISELERAERVALTRYGDGFFTNSQSGHNVGADELEALHHIRTIDRSQGSGECDRAYLQRLQRATLAAKSHYVESAEDPDGYGAATFNELLRWLERRAAL